MAQGEASIHIDRPPDEVFAIVGDAANNPLWRKNVVRTGWLDDGPMRVGRRGRQTARALGRTWTAEAEVAEWDPPRSVSWRTVQGPVTVRSWVRVEPDGTGSLVSGGADGGFTGPFGGLLTRLAVPRMIKQAEVDLRTLRDRLEHVSGPPAAASLTTDASVALGSPPPDVAGTGSGGLVASRSRLLSIGLATILLAGVVVVAVRQVRRGVALGERYGS
jgi:hypothetical protein